MAEPVLLEAVEVKAVTEKALFVKYEDEEYWIPISQVDTEATDVEFQRGATGTLAISKWIADQKGLS
jgi:hypothetical protein